MYFWDKSLHVSSSSSVHNQQFFIVHTAMGYVIQLASRIRTFYVTHMTVLIINQLDALISQMYFWDKSLHVSGSSSVHHQQFFIVHTAMGYVI